MKINESVPKNFDSVNFFRKIKDKISKETFGLSNEQMKEYLKMLIKKLSLKDLMRLRRCLKNKY